MFPAPVVVPYNPCKPEPKTPTLLMLDILMLDAEYSGFGSQ